MQAVDLTGVSRRGEVDQALKRRGAGPQSAWLPFAEPGLRRAAVFPLAPQPGGLWAERWLRSWAWPESFAGRRYDGPACFISGANSPYVQVEQHAVIKALFPKAAFDPIAGAGHWVHAEAPAPFMQSLSGFLDRL